MVLRVKLRCRLELDRNHPESVYWYAMQYDVCFSIKQLPNSLGRHCFPIFNIPVSQSFLFRFLTIVLGSQRHPSPATFFQLFSLFPFLEFSPFQITFLSAYPFLSTSHPAYFLLSSSFLSSHFCFSFSLSLFPFAFLFSLPYSHSPSLSFRLTTILPLHLFLFLILCPPRLLCTPCYICKIH
jgi:hypothetical protein